MRRRLSCPRPPQLVLHPQLVLRQSTPTSASGAGFCTGCCGKGCCVCRVQRAEMAMPGEDADMGMKEEDAQGVQGMRARHQRRRDGAQTTCAARARQRKLRERLLMAGRTQQAPGGVQSRRAQEVESRRLRGYYMCNVRARCCERDLRRKVTGWKMLGPHFAHCTAWTTNSSTRSCSALEDKSGAGSGGTSSSNRVY